MSEEPNLPSHNDVWLAPDGQLHYSAGFLHKMEQLPLAIHMEMSLTLQKIEQAINKQEYHKVRIHIMQFNYNMGRTYLSLSGSIDGKRSKQITKKESSNAYVPQDEDKPGRLKRLFGRGKKEDLAEN